MKAVIIVFIIVIIAMMPVCFTSVGMTAWSNIMGYRVMESIPESAGADAMRIKMDISQWLDNHPKDTYNDYYNGGCLLTWMQLFRLELCDYDLSEFTSDGSGNSEKEKYCAETGCPAATRNFDCDKFENDFKTRQAQKLYGANPTQEQIDSMPDTCSSNDTQWDVDCMGGAMLDCNDNGVPDDEDISLIAMTTCHRDHDYAMGGDSGCDCTYDLEGHSGYDYICTTPDTHDHSPNMNHKVFTPMGGVVVSNGMTPEKSGWGWEVVIYNCGTLTVYNHLNAKAMNPMDTEHYAFELNVGDIVNAGDAVGIMGGGYKSRALDGGSTGTHLDFRSMRCITNDTGEYPYHINNFARDTDIATDGLINNNWKNQSSTDDSTCSDWFVPMGGGGNGKILNHSCASRAGR